MSYPACLLALYTQQIWDDLPQTTINKAIDDFRKRLMRAFWPMVDIFSILCELGSRA